MNEVIVIMGSLVITMGIIVLGIDYFQKHNTKH